jgi:hypothetical protein
MANKQLSIPQMDFESGNVSENWKRWRQTMAQQVGYFLLYIGQTGRDIFNTWTIEGDDLNKLKPLYDKFTAYCNPKTNVTVARYRFNTRGGDSRPISH